MPPLPFEYDMTLRCFWSMSWRVALQMEQMEGIARLAERRAGHSVSPVSLSCATGREEENSHVQVLLSPPGGGDKVRTQKGSRKATRVMVYRAGREGSSVVVGVEMQIVGCSWCCCCCGCAG